MNFYPRSPCGERLGSVAVGLPISNFYPRSPCGERLWPGRLARPFFLISIHALLAESDALSLPFGAVWVISIHALLAESDGLNFNGRRFDFDFYPRSPCGERRVTVLGIQHRVGISIHALLAESDGKSNKPTGQKLVFLSTLSLRRATRHKTAELIVNIYFYPRSPCGERPNTGTNNSKNVVFLSTLSLRRATFPCSHLVRDSQFLSTLSLRRATHEALHSCRLLTFLSTLSLRRATQLESTLYHH